MHTSTTYSDTEVFMMILFLFVLLALAAFALSQAYRNKHRDTLSHRVDIDRQYPSAARRAHRSKRESADGGFVPFDLGSGEGSDGGDGGGDGGD